MIKDLEDKIEEQPTIKRKQRKITTWIALLIHFRLQDCYKANEFTKTT